MRISLSTPKGSIIGRRKDSQLLKQLCSFPFKQNVGLAELVKGAGLKLLSQLCSQVQILHPTPIGTLA
jgi:hypothetical protein